MQNNNVICETELEELKLLRKQCAIKVIVINKKIKAWRYTIKTPKDKKATKKERGIIRIKKVVLLKKAN